MLSASLNNKFPSFLVCYYSIYAMFRVFVILIIGVVADIIMALGYWRGALNLHNVCLIRYVSFN